MSNLKCSILFLFILSPVVLFSQVSNDDCSTAIVLDYGTPISGTTVNAESSSIAFSLCPSDLNQADVFYRIPILEDFDAAVITISDWSGNGTLGAQVFLDNGSCDLQTINLIDESKYIYCGQNETEIDISINCFPDTITHLVLKLGSETDDGDITNGEEEGTFMVALEGRTASCSFAESCDDILPEQILNPVTNPNFELDYSCITSCLEYACPESNVQGVSCGTDSWPTVWYQINVDDNAAQIFTTVETAGSWEAAWTLYGGNGCDSLVQLSTAASPPCNFDDTTPELLQQGIEDTWDVYWLAVTVDPISLPNGFEIDNPNFNVCIATTINAIICLGDLESGDCAEPSLIMEVTSRNDGQDPVDPDGDGVEGPFCPGDKVDVNIQFFYDASETGVDWLIGFVPYFGNGWDMSKFEYSVNTPVGNGMEANWYEEGGNCAPIVQESIPTLCTYWDQDGQLQLCNLLCESCPCAGNTLVAGDPLPSGYFWVTNGGNAGCENNCSPGEGWGIGTTTVDIDWKLTLFVKEFSTIDELYNADDLSINFQTFSDGVAGCWEDPVGECLFDKKQVSPLWRVNNQVTLLNIEEYENLVYEETQLDIDISISGSLEHEVIVTFVPNSNIAGANDYSFANGVGTITDYLINTSGENQLAVYNIEVIDDTGACHSERSVEILIKSGEVIGNVGGIVFVEDDYDNYLTENDHRLSGVSIQLWEDINADGVLDIEVSQAINTDVEGQFIFTNLFEGRYAILVDENEVLLGGNLYGMVAIDSSIAPLSAFPNTHNNLIDQDLTTEIFHFNNEIVDNHNTDMELMLGFIYDCSSSYSILFSDCQTSISNTFCDLDLLDKACFNMQGINENNIPDDQCVFTGSIYERWLSFVPAEGEYELAFTAKNCTLSVQDTGSIKLGIYSECSIDSELFCVLDCVSGEIRVPSNILNPGDTHFIGINTCSGNDCEIEIEVEGNFDNQDKSCNHFIEGYTFFDANMDCTNDEYNLVRNVLVVAFNQVDTFYTFSDAQGYFKFYLPEGFYNFEFSRNGEMIIPCNLNDYTNVDPVGLNEEISFYFGDISHCNDPFVELHIDNLRRCFVNSGYVTFCNTGFIDMMDFNIGIKLDDDLEFISASRPYTTLSDNTILFSIDSLEADACGLINFKVRPRCNSTVIRQSLCLEAYVLPESDCGKLSQYKGPIIDILGKCEGDDMEFIISNIGGEDMTKEYVYNILRNDQAYKQGVFQLNRDENYIISVAGDGETFTLLTQQWEDYPYGGGHISTYVEGCAPNGSIIDYGFYDLFQQNDLSPYKDISCVEIIGSYDPNVKSTAPIGYSSQNFIYEDQILKYHIEFENIGNDTAFTVRVVDEISDKLALNSMNVIGASHEFYMYSEGRKLTFLFEDINLPYTEIDSVSSHGFVTFEINQKENNIIGDIITNQVEIFFDYNEPIITNEVRHTVGVPCFLGITQEELFEDFGLVSICDEDFSSIVLEQDINGDGIFGWQGPVIEGFGVHTYDTLSNGCLYTQRVEVAKLDPYEEAVSLVSCQPFTYYGVEVNESIDSLHIDISVNEEGCDSTIYLSATIMSLDAQVDVFDCVDSCRQIEVNNLILEPDLSELENITYNVLDGNETILSTDQSAFEVCQSGSFSIEIISRYQGNSCAYYFPIDIDIESGFPDSPMISEENEYPCAGDMGPYEYNIVNPGDSIDWYIENGNIVSSNNQGVAVMWSSEEEGLICATAINDCGESKEYCKEIRFEKSPLAIDDNLDAFKNSLDFDVITNDDTVSVSDFEISLVNPPLHGLITIFDDGIVRYTPFEPETDVQDSFIYKLCNLYCSDLCSEAEVIINYSGSTVNTEEIQYSLEDLLLLQPCEINIFDVSGRRMLPSYSCEDLILALEGKELSPGVYCYQLILSDGRVVYGSFITI